MAMVPFDDLSGEAEDHSSIDLEAGETSHQSESLDNPTTEFGIERSGIRQEALFNKKSIFETCSKTFVMVPCTIAINIFASLLTSNGNGYFTLTSFPHHLFFFVVMLNFYISIIGIVLWSVLPMVARGCHIVASLCALLSLTILFDALLPDELKDVPWIFLACVVLIVFGLAVYEHREALMLIDVVSMEQNTQELSVVSLA